MKIRDTVTCGGLALAVAVTGTLVLSCFQGTSGTVTASYLACAEAAAGVPLRKLRQVYEPMGASFSMRRGGTLVGYQRFRGAHWLCAVATDSAGNILGAVRLRAEG